MALHAESMTKALGDLRAPAASNSSLSVVLDVYAALAAGSLDSVGEFFAADIVFELHDATKTMHGCWSGRPAVLAAMAANFALVDQQTPVVKSMTAQGPTVAVLFSETGVMRATGKPYTATGVQWFTIEAGKVSRMEEVIALMLS